MSRLLGVSLWYLAQIPCAPEIGFFIPRMPGFNVFDSDHRHVAERFYSPNHQDYPTTMTQLPVSTEVLFRNLEMRNALPIGRQATELAALRRIQVAEGVTNWFLCDVTRAAHGPLEIGIMPWPAGSIFRGFENLAYPGWKRTDIVSSRNGWDPESDELRLNAFATTSARMFATSTEIRLIRAEIRIAILEYLRDQEHDHGSSTELSDSDDEQAEDNEADENGPDMRGSRDSDSEDEAQTVIESEIAYDVTDEIDLEAKNGIDEDLDEVDIENSADNVIEACNGEGDPDIDDADMTESSDIDAVEDDTFDSDCSSDTDIDTASEYTPSLSEGDSSLESEHCHVSQREQDSLSQGLRDPLSDSEEDALSESGVDEDLYLQRHSFLIERRSMTSAQCSYRRSELLRTTISAQTSPSPECFTQADIKLTMAAKHFQGMTPQTSYLHKKKLDHMSTALSPAVGMLLTHVVMTWI